MYARERARASCAASAEHLLEHKEWRMLSECGCAEEIEGDFTSHISAGVAELVRQVEAERRIVRIIEGQIRIIEVSERVAVVVRVNLKANGWLALLKRLACFRNCHCIGTDIEGVPEVWTV